MGTVLVILATIATVMVVALSAVAITLSRRNRVLPDTRSPAPLAWLTSTRREAVLHRRLRAVGRRITQLPDGVDSFEICSRLKVEVVELDSRLVVIARRPRHDRRAGRAQVVHQLETIEQIVRRIEDRQHVATTSVAEIAAHLDLLEAADEDLRSIDPST